MVIMVRSVTWLVTLVSAVCMYLAVLLSIAAAAAAAAAAAVAINKESAIGNNTHLTLSSVMIR